MIKLTSATLGFEPPPPAPSIGRYAPFVMYGGIVAVVQGPLWGSDLRHVGRVGDTVDIETAEQAARLCCANLLVQLQLACEGDLARVQCCYRLGGFINTSTVQARSAYLVGSPLVSVAGARPNRKWSACDERPVVAGILAFLSGQG